MTESWARPYTAGPGRWLVIGWEVIALGLLGWAAVQQFELSGTAVHVLGWTLAAAWAIGVWRIVQHGVYVGPRGVQIRGLFRSRVVSWADIAQVRLHQATHRLGPWEVQSGMTVLIERHDGSMVNTELWAQGVDFHSRPGAFRAVYHELRTRHLSAATA